MIELNYGTPSSQTLSIHLMTGLKEGENRLSVPLFVLRLPNPKNLAFHCQSIISVSNRDQLQSVDFIRLPQNFWVGIDKFLEAL